MLSVSIIAKFCSRHRENFKFLSNMEPDFSTDCPSILAAIETYFTQGSSLQDFLKNFFSLRKSRPLIFPDFYQKLCHQSQVQLPNHPLKRIKELGKPIAESSLIFQAPVEAGILHCCDPYHKQTNHRLTAPFLQILQFKDRESDQDLKTGRVTIEVERGISWEFLPGIPPLKFCSYQEKVLWLLWGPFSFELTLTNLTLLFHIVPLDKDSFILEVSLYYLDFLPKNVFLLSQILFQLLCDFTLAEDLVYIEQVRNKARDYLFSPDPFFHPSSEVILLYRQLYGSVLANLLKESIALNSRNQ